MNNRNPIHFKQGQQLLDVAKETHQKVWVEAWASDGRIIRYDGWLVVGSFWRGGFHRLISPVSNEIRTVPDIMIFKINGHPIYL